MVFEERRPAPPGLFRVIGYDQFDYTDYTVGDFPTAEEAHCAAQNCASQPNGIPTSFSDIYFIYNDQGVCLRRITYDDLHRVS